MLNAEETKHIHACIKENYVVKGKGHLNYQNLHSVIIKDKDFVSIP
jgi:hypothetical protein